jgi:hypothetical protein
MSLPLISEKRLCTRNRKRIAGYAEKKNMLVLLLTVTGYNQTTKHWSPLLGSFAGLSRGARTATKEMS